MEPPALTHAASNSNKRPAAAPEAARQGQQPAGPARQKRAKYISKACKICQRRKLKCIREPDDAPCQRCIADGEQCDIDPRAGIRGRRDTDAGRTRQDSMSVTVATFLGGGPEASAAGERRGRASTARHSTGSLVSDQYDDDPRLAGLTREISSLQHQVASLLETVKQLSEGQQQQSQQQLQQLPQQQSAADSRPCPPDDQQQPPDTMSGSSSRAIGSRSAKHKSPDPIEPHFIGPTRSAFSLRIAESALTEMGIEPGTDSNENDGSGGGLHSIPSTRGISPQEGEEARGPQLDNTNADDEGTRQENKDPLLRISPIEVRRLLGVFYEEIETVYPCVETAKLSTAVDGIFAELQRQQYDADPNCSENDQMRIRILKVAVATAIVIEARGKNAASTQLVKSASLDMSMTSRTDVDLQGVQLYTMLSIYHFHCDEDLMAWRVIGTAARAALELGLHRRRSLVDNFQADEDRSLAVRVFWCVYALDRRWSFGTSLSFALDDREIDSELPEPGEDFMYLGCMVGYGRLCTKLWEALPPFGSASSHIPKDKVQYLDYLVQEWLGSIPPDLQLRHPRLASLTPTQHMPQPRDLFRLRALLYLRGNHVRTMIRRHHVLSSTAVEANPRSARAVVDIAHDTIAVLIHLHEMSDIYARQQSAFNYFLLSALAVILLAVCHAPRMFAESCRGSFMAALELVRGFSKHSTASRRLWRTLRGLVPRIQSLELRAAHSGRDAGKGGAVPSPRHVTRGPLTTGNSVNGDGWKTSARQSVHARRQDRDSPIRSQQARTQAHQAQDEVGQDGGRPSRTTGVAQAMLSGARNWQANDLTTWQAGWDSSPFDSQQSHQQHSTNPYDPSCINVTSTIPDAYQMSDNLMDLFDAAVGTGLGGFATEPGESLDSYQQQQQPQQDSFTGCVQGESSDDLFRRFHALI